MQQKVEHITPPTSPRKQEEKRLYAEAEGTFAPIARVRGSFFDAGRKDLVERHVSEGLQRFDERQQELDRGNRP